MNAGNPLVLGITMGTMVTTGCIMDDYFANIYYDTGHVELPCFVAFTEAGCLFGRMAYIQMENNPENTIYDVKRLLGRFYDDPDIQDYLKEWPFKVISDNNKPKYQVTCKGRTTTYFPEEVMAMLFKRIKEHAESHLRIPLMDAVITVPPQFNCLQRQSTLDAARIAGLNPISILNETMAAAVVYGFLKPQLPGENDKNIAMITTGCGFIDVSLITYGQRVFECRASRGSCTMDINRNMVHYFAAKIQQKHGIDVFTDKRAYALLWKACEAAKCILSQQNEATVKINSIAPGVNFEDVITKGDLREILLDLRTTIQDVVEQCMADVDWVPGFLDECVLIGGSCKVPCILQLFHEMGSQVSQRQIMKFPKLASLVGAGMRAASLKGGIQMGLEDLVILEVAPKTVTVLSREGKCRPFVRHNDNIPHWSTREYTMLLEYQADFYLEIYEGESKVVSCNKLVGRYCVTDFPLRKRGRTHLRVTFQIDSCGLLVITAEDKSLGAEEGPVTVRNESGIILREELPRIVEQFRESFPPEPIPPMAMMQEPHHPGVGHPAQHAPYAQFNAGVDGGAGDGQPGNVQQAGNVPQPGHEVQPGEAEPGNIHVQQEVQNEPLGIRTGNGMANANGQENAICCKKILMGDHP